MSAGRGKEGHFSDVLSEEVWVGTRPPYRAKEALSAGRSELLLIESLLPNMTNLQKETFRFYILSPAEYKPLGYY